MSSASAPEFGPNDWFVEEKYQQFLADPDSVDEIWRDFFADNATANARAQNARAQRGGPPAVATQSSSSGSAAATPAPPNGSTRATPPPPPVKRRADAAPTTAAAAGGRAPDEPTADKPPKKSTDGPTDQPAAKLPAKQDPDPSPNGPAGTARVPTATQSTAPVRAGGKEIVDIPGQPKRPATTATRTTWST